MREGNFAGSRPAFRTLLPGRFGVFDPSKSGMSSPNDNDLFEPEC